ncbi:hypothetical protein CLV70_1684 [Pseudosporangium ferrugineum]|uniref:Uncharacterized protein n=1 Tax=Pseudosporangium ferrugineum TaxID=439699 RepID=A0A2T0R447_9ACTN|nr:hypothetical protein CLV70_1684 [Pseudosporangium ferrugineum]
MASGLFLKAEEPALAAICADRSFTAAVSTGDELIRASSTRAVVHTLLTAGHAAAAVDVAVTAADRLAARTDMRTDAALSLYGALLLRGAVAAARLGDISQAHRLLDDAEHAATRLGADRNVCWTAFGPTNVAAHRVAIAVESGDAGTAVRLARTVDLRQMKLPERKAMLLLDAARAFTQWGKCDQALECVQRAEQQAPEEVRSRPAVQQLVLDIVQRSPASAKRRAQEFAATVGVLP